MNEQSQAQPVRSEHDLASALAQMQAQGGTLTAEITVTRAGTGAVEKHTLVLTQSKEQ